MTDGDFEELWRSHFSSVARGAFLVTGDTHEAADLAQEAFTRAFQRWRKVSRLERPEAWVHRVAINLAISHRRRKVPRLQRSEEAAPPEPPDEELTKAFMALTPSQRAVIALRFYLDWSVDDAARALGKQPGTIRALTHQGMKHLRESLSKEPQDD
jgi:RNA polymerase sigma factor (sigma-70 family)